MTRAQLHVGRNRPHVVLAYVIVDAVAFGQGWERGWESGWDAGVRAGEGCERPEGAAPGEVAPAEKDYDFGFNLGWGKGWGKGWSAGSASRGEPCPQVA